MSAQQPEPKTRTFQATTLEEALAKVKRAFGEGAHVLSADRVRTGGVGGFFSREHVEVVVEVPAGMSGDEATTRRTKKSAHTAAAAAPVDGDATAADDESAAGETAAGPTEPAAPRASAPMSIEDLADTISEVERAVVTSEVMPEPIAAADLPAPRRSIPQTGADAPAPMRAAAPAAETATPTSSAPSTSSPSTTGDADAPWDAESFEAVLERIAAAGTPLFSRQAARETAASERAGIDERIAPSTADAAVAPPAPSAPVAPSAPAPTAMPMPTPTSVSAPAAPAADDELVASTTEIDAQTSAMTEPASTITFAEAMGFTDDGEREPEPSPFFSERALDAAAHADEREDAAPEAAIETPVAETPVRSSPRGERTIIDAASTTQARAIDATEATPVSEPGATRELAMLSTASLELAQGLVALGVPQPIASGIDPERDLLPQLIDRMRRLPKAQPIPTERGTVVAVVGWRRAALATARDLAAELGLDADDVWFASSRGADAEVEETQALATALDAASQRRSWRRKDEPTIIAVDAALGSRDLAWAERMLAALAPTDVWGTVDATRKTEDVAAWVDAVGGVDTITVIGAHLTQTPAAVLSLDVPVVLLDGERATPERWATLLSARLMPA